MLEFIHKTNQRSRSIRLQVNAKGEVIVSSHPRVSQTQIKVFVEQNQAWITAQKAKIAARRAQNRTEDQIQLFGKSYQRQLTCSSEQAYGVKVIGDTLQINTLATLDQKPNLRQAEQLLQRFLQNTAEKYLIPRTHQLAAKMQTTVKRITLKQQKTRWGSCSSQGNINFNWSLVHYAPEIIDYVIIHELAHRHQMNHSAAFWAIVAKFDPSYARHRRWLQNHGLTEG